MSRAKKQDPIELVCLDMAGTTVADDGLVLRAFAAAQDIMGIDAASPKGLEMTKYVTDTMGTSKIEVFRALYGEESRAREANRAFEEAFDGLLDSGGISPIPGARAVIDRLQLAGMKVALTTGFSPSTRDRLLDALGWEDVAHAVLSPADAGRGRPHPDMILHALVRLEISSVSSVAVVGDTAADMESGRRAGAQLVVGVLTGADDRERLVEAGATHVLDSVAELPVLLGIS